MAWLSSSCFSAIILAVQYDSFNALSFGRLSAPPLSDGPASKSDPNPPDLHRRGGTVAGAFTVRASELMLRCPIGPLH